ncbi:hypothetical protein [Halalkalibacter oceani]|uniref:hypothetical protein n=1 Tax=Halalkalibacter oceani TaxID=1653776 RepID=UPI003398EE07
MKNSFDKAIRNMKVYITYEGLFGSKVPIEKIKRDINKINQSDALKVLSCLNWLNEDSKSQLIQIICEQASVKMQEEFEISFDNSNILYAIKWFLAFGNNKAPSTVSSVTTAGNFVVRVVMILLQISDHIHLSHENDSIEQMYMKISLFYRDSNIDRSIIRQNLFFQKYAKNKSLFEPNEYMDINNDFYQYYGYKIDDYVNVLLAAGHSGKLKNSLKDLFNFYQQGIKLDSYFSKLRNSDLSSKILADIVVDPKLYKDKAIQTIDNAFDNEYLITSPFFKIDDRAFMFSNEIHNQSIFDGLYFKLIKCYEHDKKLTNKFFTFFGRLFEIYIADTLKNSVSDSKLSYEYIDEFYYDKDNKRSSDAYIKLGKSLLIIEAKSGKIPKQSKTKPSTETIRKDFSRLFFNPNKQAFDTFKALRERGYFIDIKKVFILSSTYNTLSKTPTFYEEIFTNDLQSVFTSPVKFVDQIGINDLECLAYFFQSQEKSVFRSLENKKNTDPFSSYVQYYYNHYGEYRRTNYHDSTLKQAFVEMGKFFGIPKERELS